MRCRLQQAELVDRLSFHWSSQESDIQFEHIISSDKTECVSGLLTILMILLTLSTLLESTQVRVTGAIYSAMTLELSQVSQHC